MVIPTSMPVVDEEMEKEMLRALREEFFVGGKSVEKFEEEFAEYIGTDYAVAVSSGTDALVIALRCLGIKSKVITTPMTFVATAESIVLAGAKPKFADIEASTWNISSEEIEKAIDKDVETIMPVHLYGLPCEMKEIMDIAEDKGLHVIEDCAQAHGAEYKGRKVGSIGEIGCFSFYSTKNMTVAGNGGMITTNDKKVAEVAKLLREHGGSNFAEYIGYNARMNTVNAAFGRVQLKRVDEWNMKRRRIAKLYHEYLKNLEKIKLPALDERHVYHLFVIEAENRNKLREYLRSKEIFCGIHYPVAIHKLKPYEKYAEREYPNAEHHAETCLSLPIYPTLKEEELKMVCNEIKAFYGE
ncbi:MAG TPA: DegT/DnrJ/EryC1/StrS family aminotransferase [Thermoplasmatales archaeon]|nr:DegT/DnrJ/EryC1/StrS family aminotransferase [Thermoplasmatales archaeon]